MSRANANRNRYVGPAIYVPYVTYVTKNKYKCHIVSEPACPIILKSRKGPILKMSPGKYGLPGVFLLFAQDLRVKPVVRNDRC